MFNKNRYLLFSLIFVIGFCSDCFAFDLKEDVPIVVNGDNVEFFTELNKIVAEGHVKIEYGKATLTCDRITVFTQSKEGFAEGNVKLEDENGVIEGRNVFYNFDKQTGRIVEANIKMAPYYCVSPEAKKSPTKIILNNANVTTCNLDVPHYHFHARQVEITPGDKLRAKGVTFYAGEVPIMHLPLFVQDISEKHDGLSFSPGRSKEWGSFLLSAYRYHFTDDIRGYLRADWRTNKGWAAGFDLESYTDNFGDSRLQVYQAKESLHGQGEVEPIFKVDERYKIEYRHKWDIDDNNHFIMELNDYSDVNFLKNYFYRQYEKDSQPDSYVLYSHSYPSSTFSLFMQKRFNQFYTEIEKIPEIKLDTVSFKIMDTPFYYQNQSSFSSLTSRTAYTDQDEDTVRMDTFNKLSHPFKFAFFELNPYVGTRYTLYSKDKNGDENLFRNVFYSGYDILTKFYRTFDDVKISSYGLEIDKLRHVITPSFSYDYIHDPTLPAERLTAFDSIDSITNMNTLTLSLENKLQTKRGGLNVDFLTFIISSPYDFKLENHGGRFGDMDFDLEILPNSKLRFWSDAHFDLRRRSFRTANFDIQFTLDEKDKIGASYRYMASDPEDDELFTFSFERQLNPKWKFRSYQRFQFTSGEFEEQEYALSRDLHCWEIDYVVNSKRKKGVTFWLVFRCKAFPDMGFDITKSHQQPKTR